MPEHEISHIHYLEDSDDEAFLSRLLLESQNVSSELVHHANYRSFDKVLSAKKTDEPMLALIDLNMPLMKGTEVIQSALEKTPDENLIIGICSGSEDPADKRNADKVGARFFVNKPLDVKMLMSVCSVCAELHIEKDYKGGVSIKYRS